ncbi:MAG: UDP-N-acetylglucosamine diphosphorylase, partial [Oscillospiraceae bacterium]
DNITAGPFAYVRPNCHVAQGVKIGDFVELKNSNIGAGTKVPHLTYVGDSDVGEHVNFGCGTVTVNYDGTEKHRCTVGDNAFLGCNTNLVAPVTVGAGAFTAAGSTITSEVPADSLAVARARQIIKPDWAKKRKTRS